MASQRSGGDGRRWRRQGNRESLDLRFPPAPYCKCGKKVEMRSMETVDKVSLGKLYFICRSCGYFNWVHPYSATWVPSGFPICPLAGEVFERSDLDMHEVEGKFR